MPVHAKSTQLNESLNDSPLERDPRSNSGVMELTLDKVVEAGRDSDNSRVIDGFVYLCLLWPGSQAIRSKPTCAHQLTSGE